MNLQTGSYGTDYLLRAATAKQLLIANIPDEAVYPYTPMLTIKAKILRILTCIQKRYCLWMDPVYQYV
jgi:hypothetical protein